MSLISKKKFMNGIEKNQSKAAGSVFLLRYLPADCRPRTLRLFLPALAISGIKLHSGAIRLKRRLPSAHFLVDDVNAAIERARAMKTVERDQVRGMRRTSKLLEGEIYNREVEQADTHFSGTGLSENGKSVTQLQNEIDALQERKAQVDSQSVLARAQEAIGNLSEEDQKLLRQYRGKELNGYQVRAYAKYDAKTALNEKGYDDEKLKQLAEWQKVLDDYENAQKLDAAAQEIGQRSPVGGTLFSAALAPGKALGNLESLRGVLPSWAGGYQNEDMPTNVYSPAYNATRLSSGIRGSVMQGMSPTGQFLYQAGTSALDSAVNMAVSTGLVDHIIRTVEPVGRDLLRALRRKRPQRLPPNGLAAQHVLNDIAHGVFFRNALDCALDNTYCPSYIMTCTNNLK